MVRYIFVAGVYAAAVLAAPAQNAAEVGAAPAGWGDNSPSLGATLFGWARPNREKPESSTAEGAGPSSWYTPPSSSSSRDWSSLFGGGSRGDRGSKGGSGAGSSAPPPSSSSSRDWGSLFGGYRGGSGADSSAPPRGSSSGGFFGGLFGGSSRPKPASSGSSGGSYWGRPKPDSAKPKPEWKPNADPADAKPAPSESSEEDEASPLIPAPKPEPAQPKPEVTQPKPETAAPVPASIEPKPEPAQANPEPAQPKPESEGPLPVLTPSEAQPTPAEPKPDTEAVPKPAAEGSESACGPKTRRPDSEDIETIRKQLWQPKIGDKWQIILDGVPDTRRAALNPADAHIWDIDMWDSKASNICDLKKQGKKVICYFSAGTSETWRPDNDKLKGMNLGPIYKGDDEKGGAWEGEEWIDIRKNEIRDIMRERIKMAAQKGCDALDPDNLDGYDNKVKKAKLTEDDSVKYMKFLADEAARWGMSIGLKNSLSIIPKVKSYIQFAVNEECAKVKECQEYKELLAVKRPVFHIEYTSTSGSNAATTRTTYKDPNGATKKYCNPLREAVSRFSTIIKAGETLGNQYLYCDGKPAGFTAMLSYTDKKGGKSRTNAIESENSPDEESSGFEANERFSNSTLVARRDPLGKIKKRRHGRHAVLVHEL